jgi:hypothetical protein
LAGTSAARGRWKGSGGCNLPADGTTEVTEIALLGLDCSSLLRLSQELILALPLPALLRLQRLWIFSIRYINNKDLSTCIYLSFMQHQMGIFVSNFRY